MKLGVQTKDNNSTMHIIIASNPHKYIYLADPTSSTPSRWFHRFQIGLHVLIKTQNMG